MAESALYLNITLEENGTAMEVNGTDEGDNFDELVESVNAFFLIALGILIFFMQGGFAFLEAGAVRSKNTVNILIKNMLDCLIGAIAYWAIGWGLAYGEDGNGFAGASEFFGYKMAAEKFPKWFFQFVFAATAATIVSGSIAERVQFSAYFIYSVLITGLLYPPVSHWAWDESGWLLGVGYQDFAGSGVVHTLGGVCALVACSLVGPRLGRFDEDGKPYDMPGHSVPLAALGGFILFFGFLAFNGGSQLAIATPDDVAAVSAAIFNTILGGSAGGIVVLFFNKFLCGYTWSYLLTLNGALAGMVAQCAGCNVYATWAAVVVGTIGGLAYLGTHFVMLKLRLDDPLDAVAVHGGAGVVGVICAPIFSFNNGILYAGDTTAPWNTLGFNVLGLFCIILWSAVCSLVIFGGLRLAGLLRIDRETEFSGNDTTKHGESAYPAPAWVEMQYNKSTLPGSATPPPHMSGTHLNKTVNVAHYNDAFEMLPEADAKKLQTTAEQNGSQNGSA